MGCTDYPTLPNVGVRDVSWPCNLMSGWIPNLYLNQEYPIAVPTWHAPWLQTILHSAKRIHNNSNLRHLEPSHMCRYLFLVLELTCDSGPMRGLFVDCMVAAHQIMVNFDETTPNLSHHPCCFNFFPKPLRLAHGTCAAITRSDYWPKNRARLPPIQSG